MMHCSTILLIFPGIAHIHSAKLTHGNIKSSNILLTEALNARVSDFGLIPITTYTHAKCGATTCQAPEITETRKISTQKSDVFSFGVILLEMLTGKSPNVQYSGYGAKVDLPKWVLSVVREEWTAEVFDIQLMKYANAEEEMVQMLQIGLSCVAEAPDVRPSMNEVVNMIEGVRDFEMESTRTSYEDDRSK